MNNDLLIRFTRLVPEATAPTKAHMSDAGFDLTCTSMEEKDGVLTYHTGIAVEIPEGHVGLLFPRSSIYKYDLFLTNSVGVIDSGYRGEVMFKFKVNPNNRIFGAEVYRVGERLGQLIVIPYPNVLFVESDNLSGSDRGTSGYGGSGR